MYVKLDNIQSRTETWIQSSYKEGKWSANAVINTDGQLIDARLKSGLRPSPVTRDLQWGVPVPTLEGADNEEMKGKVLCTLTTAIILACCLSSSQFRCLGACRIF